MRKQKEEKVFCNVNDRGGILGVIKLFLPFIYVNPLLYHNKPPNVHKKRFFLGGDSETRIYLKKI